MRTKGKGRDVRLNCVLSAEEGTMLREMSDEAGETMSVVVRRWIRANYATFQST